MKQKEKPKTAPVTISEQEHGIHIDQLCPHAIQIIQRLHQAGHEAYLVGGAIRDLVLSRTPKDFDVATDATPDQLVELFSRCRRIGRRFEIVHVYSGRKYTEVSTFRAATTDQHTHPNRVTNRGVLVRDNVYGTVEEDALRRDFTINALYMDIRDARIIDYCGGYRDLHDRVLHTIGPANQRFREDPVRILRALRFHAKLEVELSADLVDAVHEQSEGLLQIPPARLLDELIKLFHSGFAQYTWKLLDDFNLLPILFPTLHKRLQESSSYDDFIYLSLHNTDLRVRENKPLNPAFILAVILWPDRQHRIKRLGRPKKRQEEAQLASVAVIRDQSDRVAIPKRLAHVILEIWALQRRFMYRKGKRALQLVQHRRFRAAYDFMCLRAQAGEIDSEICSWWTEQQTLSAQEQKNRTRPQRTRREDMIEN